MEARNWGEASDAVKEFLSDNLGVDIDSPLLDSLAERTLGFMCDVIPRTAVRDEPRSMFAVDKEEIARQVRAGQAHLTNRMEDLENINRRLLDRNEELEITLRVMAGLQANSKVGGHASAA